MIFFLGFQRRIVLNLIYHLGEKVGIWRYKVGIEELIKRIKLRFEHMEFIFMALLGLLFCKS